jgi:phenylacetate-CoA ligase
MFAALGRRIRSPVIGMRDPYTLCVSTLLFPLHERAKRHATVAVRLALERSQWFDPEHLAELQLRRLRTLLSNARANVPYYRDLFARLEFNPATMTSTRDLSRLPFLTKPIVRENIERLKSARATDLIRFNTGGSSGEPMVFFMGRERVSHDVAAKWRATRWFGVDIGDREIVVWGSPVELGVQDRLRGLRDRMLRSELLPAFEMSDTKLSAFVDRIRRQRPKMLFGYPSALSHIARHASKNGVRLDDLGIRVAFVTSERLYDEQRELIARAFGCAVANGYGGRDAGFIAHDCPAGGMHITAEDIVVETVDAAGVNVPSGAAGEIVVTHLATSDFPFIRYRTGDIGVLDDRRCECGRGLPLLRELQGRTTDFVVARDGTVMHGLALIYILRDLPGIEAFRIVQEDLELTRVELVVNAHYGPEIEATIVRGFKARLGASVRVAVDQVVALEPEKSGKFRYVVSRVAA